MSGYHMNFNMGTHRKGLVFPNLDCLVAIAAVTL